MRDSLTRRRALTSLSAASGTLVAGCTDYLGNDGTGSDGAFEETVKIGFVTPLTTTYALIGQESLATARMAAKHINDAGGINGRKLEIVRRDSQIDPSVAVNEARELIQDEGVEALAGPVSSSVALAMLPVAKRAGILMNVGVTGARSITGEKCNKYAFRFRNHSEIQNIALASYLRNEGYRSAAIFNADFSWGNSEAKWFRNEFEANGGEIRSHTKAPLGTTDYSSYLPKIDTSAELLVAYVGGNDAVNFIKDADSFGLTDSMQLAGTSALITPDVLSGVGERANGLIAINYYPQWLSGPLDTEANSRFHETFKEETDYNRAPSRYATPNWEPFWAFKKAADASDYTGTEDTDALIGELDGMQMDESFQFPQGEKYIRGKDNQAMLKQYMTKKTSDGGDVLETMDVTFAEQAEVVCDI